MKGALVAVLRLIVAFAMPVVILLGSARIIINDWYPRYEYAKPDFPADRYGMTQAERLELGTACIDFLNLPQPAEEAIAMLEALRLPGTDEPLFDANELGHMEDVKRLTDVLWVVLWAAAAAVVAGLAVLVARRSTRRDGYAALFGGGVLTTVLLVLLILFVLTSWRTFFIAFHDVFFEPGTWTFDWSDSLIRIFPDRFFFDAGVLLVGGALAAGIVVALIGFLLNRFGAKH